MPGSNKYFNQHLDNLSTINSFDQLIPIVMKSVPDEQLEQLPIESSSSDSLRFGNSNDFIGKKVLTRNYRTFSNPSKLFLNG